MPNSSSPQHPSALQTTDFSSFVKDAQTLLDRCIELMRSKANDYADGGDAFVNFKTAAQVAGISPEQTLLTLLGMKISRLTQLVGKGKRAQNESVEDTMLDIINYVLLLRGMMQEQRPSVAVPASTPAPTPASVPSSPTPVPAATPAHERTITPFSQSAPNLLQS